MGLRCWNGETCRRLCVVPCRPTLNEIDPRLVLIAPPPKPERTTYRACPACGVVRHSNPTPWETPHDWRKILKVYIGAILQAESITFMRDVPKSALTDDEHAALLALDAEVKRETPYA